MATTVTTAFDQFMREAVNLNPSAVSSARSSRDWLLSQIEKFPVFQANFPALYDGMSMNFGSFARKTKKRPLDDIDLMICFNADGCSYDEIGQEIKIIVNNADSKFRSYLQDGTNYLSSIRIVNKYVSALTSIPQYKKSDIKRNQEAAVLELSTYDWSFDIVPCFFTAVDIWGRQYYLIPDGNGHWKKTDPRIDQSRATTINQANNGNVLNMIRAIKYWNARQTMPTISSYLLEVMVLNYYENNGSCSKYVDLEMTGLLKYLSLKVLSSVADPKGIVTNINMTSLEDRVAVSNRASVDSTKASEARQLETDLKMKESINKWREVFGAEFPQYG